MNDNEISILRAREEWHEHRRRCKGIGASDVPKILGYSRFESRLDAWGRLTGRYDYEDDSTEAAEWGGIHEPTLLREYAAREECVVLCRNEFNEIGVIVPSGRWHGEFSAMFERWIHADYFGLVDEIRHPELEFLFCHLDGVRFDKPHGPPQKLLEAKTASVWMGKEWGDPDTDEVPPVYLVQGQTQSAVVESQYGLRLGIHYPALIGGNKWGIYRTPARADVQRGILHEVGRFWREHIVADEPPPPQSAEEHERALKWMFPTTTGEEVTVVSSERIRKVRELRLAREELKLAEIREKEAANAVKELMGDDYKWVAPDESWSITWGEVKGRPSWKSIAELLAKQFDADLDDLLEEHRGKSFRMFRPNLDKMEV